MGLNLHNKNLDFLFKAVLALENVEECYDFFEDLCTVQELNAISQRIVVAKMLSEKISLNPTDFYAKIIDFAIENEEYDPVPEEVSDI